MNSTNGSNAIFFRWQKQFWNLDTKYIIQQSNEGGAKGEERRNSITKPFHLLKMFHNSSRNKKGVGDLLLLPGAKAQVTLKPTVKSFSIFCYN